MFLPPDVERYEMRREDVEEFYSRRTRVPDKQTKIESKRCNHRLRSTRGCYRRVAEIASLKLHQVILKLFGDDHDDDPGRGDGHQAVSERIIRCDRRHAQGRWYEPMAHSPVQTCVREAAGKFTENKSPENLPLRE
jgi:hypothetical protein